jgi:hypothetical protein
MLGQRLAWSPTNDEAPFMAALYAPNAVSENNMASKAKNATMMEFLLGT